MNICKPEDYSYIYYFILLKDLPHEYVPPDMIQKVADHGATNKIYACEVGRKDHLVRIKGGPYDATEYDEHPDRYISVFSKKVTRLPKRLPENLIC